MSKREGLDKYVRRILKEKGLSLSDVERRAQGSISDSYIAGITGGNVKNLTVEKMRALARGLGVAEDRIIAAATGSPVEEDSEFQQSEFAALFYKYNDLPDQDKREMRTLLEVLDREIDRRHTRRSRL